MVRHAVDLADTGRSVDGTGPRRGPLTVLRYVAGRLLQAVAVMFLVASLTFVLLHLAPGDPFSSASESVYTSPDVVKQMRQNFGLDQPIRVQYRLYLSNLARGNLGYSFSQSRPVWDAFRERVPNTLLLAIAALAIDFAVGIGLGVAQGSRSGSRIDRWATIATLTLYSMPVFWLAQVLMVVFGEKLGWWPTGGIHDPVTWAFRSPLGRSADLLWHLFLPALALGLVGAAGTARYQRAQLLEVIQQDYVRTARAKGLAERVVLWRHALRNALLPTITLIGLSLPALLSGAVLVETVFAWPGMGLLTTDAIARRDYPLVTGAAVLAGALVVLSNLVADILAHAADPRTRSIA
ncbi:MAG: ABC transporter permease [Gemmatimonadetes bacterium]|nr:ABC transporter permease [Gemmatimonadota bacterium]